MQVKREIEMMRDGDILEVSASDPGFATDLPAWCRSLGHEVIDIAVKDGKIVGRIRKGGAKQKKEGEEVPREKSMVVFSNDLDRAMAAFIIANGAASMGCKVNMFFTFWGLNLLRKTEKVQVRKGFMEKMFGWMMPRGATKTKLSKMNMGGMGTRMMKGVMRKKNVNTLEELIEMARQQEVRLIACSMTMDIMGLKKEELFDGVEEGGVAAFLESADRSNTTLFI
jgi:peroxiredoxin family protein/TusA-related sulfurtransferase